MKKQFAFFVLCFLLMGMLNAQNFRLVSSDFSRLQVSLSAAPCQVGQQTISGVSFSTLTMSGAISSGSVGNPNLPTFTQTIEMPICDDVVITLGNPVFDTLSAAQLGLAHAIAPVQPSRSKSDRGPATLVQNAVTYATDGLYAESLVKVNRIGIARDRNLASLVFSPVQYNPVSGQVVVCKSVDVTITFINADRAATQQMRSLHGSQAFSASVNTLNSLPMPKSVRTDAPVVYQIVAHSSFRGQLDSLIAWKQRKGYIVHANYTDESNVGTSTTSITNFLTGLYTNATAQNPAPTYVLLVGDNEQIPAHSQRVSSGAGHITDLYFFTWTSGDNIPDCYYGRFSAQTIAQLTPQVEKTLMYERYGFADPSFLSKSVLIAGVDGGYSGDHGYEYADPTLDYVASNYVNAAHGFNTVYYYKNNTNSAPAGVTVSGSSQSNSAASTLRNLYNTEGTAWVNYTAHGSNTSWADPSFSTSDVAQMTNSQKFGFMIGNCCQSNSFQYDCFGESLLQKGNYCGAVAYFGGSDYTYWSEDVYWAVGLRSSISSNANFTYDANHLGVYDRLNHEHGESYSDWYTTSGAMLMAGNLAVESSTSSLKQYYWEIYHLMGDPSITPWFGPASTLTVTTNPSVLFVGSSSLVVTAVPYAYVALTDGNGTLIAATYADATGNAELSFDGLSNPGSVELAVSAQGYRTSFTSLDVVVLDGPYIKTTQLTANGGATISAGDNVVFDVQLQNIGAAANESLSIEFQTEASHILLSNGGIQQLSNVLAADQTLSLTAVAQGQVWASVPDGTASEVRVIVRWGNRADQKSTARFMVNVVAPQIDVASTTFTGTSEPGNTLQLALVNTNNGHAAYANATSTLISPDPAVVITTGTQQLGTVDPQSSVTTNYTIELSQSLTNNAVIPLYQIVSNGQLSYTNQITLVVGQGSVEDFESADFTQFEWMQDGTNLLWQVTNSESHDGTYSARSNSSTGHGQTSALKLVWTSSIDDSISFWRMASSENNYDFFYFYIDNQEMDRSSGTNNSWERVSFFVPAGTHTFLFTYEKDGSVSRGDDCAYIDGIQLPKNGAARQYTLDTVCQGEDYTFRGQEIESAQLEAGIHYYQDSADNQYFFLMLTVFQTPDVTIQASSTQIMAGQEVLLTASGANSYLWSTGDQVPQLHVYPTETTEYGVIGFNGRCADSASVTIVVEGSIGIQGAEQLQLALYPNPAADRMQLSNIPAQALLVELFDLNGRQVRSWNVTDSHLTLSLSGIAPGVYIIRCGDQSRRVVIK